MEIKDKQKYINSLFTNYILFSKNIEEDIFVNKDYILSMNYLKYFSKFVSKMVEENIYPSTVLNNIKIVSSMYEEYLITLKKRILQLKMHYRSDVHSYDLYMSYKNLKSGILSVLPKLNSDIDKITFSNPDIYYQEFIKRYTSLKDFNNDYQGVSLEHLEESIRTDFLAYEALEIDELSKYNNSELYLESLSKFVHDIPEIFYDKKLKKQIKSVLENNIDNKDLNSRIKILSSELLNKINSIKVDYENKPFDIDQYKKILTALFLKKEFNSNDGINEDNEELYETEYLNNIFSEYISEYPYRHIIGAEFKLSKLYKNNPDLPFYLYEIVTKLNLFEALANFSKRNELSTYINESISYDYEVIKSLSSDNNKFNELLENRFFQDDNFIYTLRMIIEAYPVLLKDFKISTRLIDIIELRDIDSEKKYIKKIESYAKKSNR